MDFYPSLVAQWHDDISRWLTTTPVTGFDGTTEGPMNVPIRELAENALYLKKWLLDNNQVPAIRNCIVAGKITNGAPALLSLVSGQIRLNADVNNPAIISFSGGFDDDKAVEYLVKVAANIDIAPVNVAGFNLVFAQYNTTTRAVSLVVRDVVSITAGYIEPTSPADGDYWYNLNTDKQMRRVTGVWVQVYEVFLGAVSAPGGTAVHQPYRLDYQKRFGRSAFPVGGVVAIGNQNGGITEGFLLCNGAAISRVAYAALFAVIGTTFGTGDGSTTFNLPDLRGEFIRGLDNTRGIDVGRTLGSAQGGLVGPHTHPIQNIISDAPGVNGFDLGGYDNGIADEISANGANVVANTGSETRPRNVALNFVIKY